MGCDYCGARTRTALYIECVRHKACSGCFKLEQVRRRQGKACYLCAREDAAERRKMTATAWAPSEEQETISLKGSDSGSIEFIDNGRKS